MAPDVAVRPSEVHVPRPLIPHPGPPPSTTTNRNHARIICEIANAQKLGKWEERCETWMHEIYVRCVFGVKIYDITTSLGTAQRAMIAKLWTRQALEGSVLSTNATLATAGVRVKTWDFGTMQFNTLTPTACTGANLPTYQVTIPISDVFWNPPIVNGIVNEAGYTPTVPNEVVDNNFVIDLYGIQRWVQNAQK
ncbi:11537_t:CDS:2 [Acaulospora colombiana]|uniref:11537_t:CDS:1 n=1 Tax=Acaulospora colombiana TaxID=27376 RepID=A0ACA9M0W8_9GLOM|nr:11537_t:CDS:2 [Acaulospora colombiana]